MRGGGAEVRDDASWDLGGEARAHWWTWMMARRKLVKPWAKAPLTPARFDVLFVLGVRGRMMQLEKRDSFMSYMEVDDTIGEAFGGAWFGRSCGRLLIWERVCRRVRHACGDTLFKRAFGWIQEPDD